MNVEELKALFDFYDCKDQFELLDALSDHVDRLQEKLKEAEKREIRPFKWPSGPVRRG